MSTVLRLDEWTPNWAAEVRAIAGTAGPVGFTADDLRSYALVNHLPLPRNPGSVLGALVARGVLETVGDERSHTRSSKGRRVRRFLLREDTA